MESDQNNVSHAIDFFPFFFALRVFSCGLDFRSMGDASSIDSRDFKDVDDPSESAPATAPSNGPEFDTAS